MEILRFFSSTVPPVMVAAAIVNLASFQPFMFYPQIFLIVKKIYIDIPNDNFGLIVRIFA